MNAARIIADKRDGKRISDERLADLIAAYTRGEVPDYQMAAFAMAVFFQGMQPNEVVALTREMLGSGQRMNWHGFNKPVVDKHSTGGIGDKISITLAPALAACGLAVPMISGRGLGATGGTLDKLESIPGFRTDLSIRELQQVVKEVGCVITGASDEIAPADRRLYALRDVTATVPAVPLITSSILSKKLAEGLDALVLDVKWGSGSFMKTSEAARTLAESLVSVASAMGVRSSALITDMNQPLGQMIGNAVEVDECIDVLLDVGPREIFDLTVRLGAELLVATNLADSIDSAEHELGEVIASGKAMEIFERMVRAQGGDINSDRHVGKRHKIVAEDDGFIGSIDAEALGWIVIRMGGGRRKIGDTLDHSTGLQMMVKVGEWVERGQPLVKSFCDDHDLWEQIRPDLRAAIHLVDHEVDPLPLIVDRVAPQSESETAS